MRRLPVHQTAQFWLALAGSWFLVVGIVGGLAAVEPVPAGNPPAGSNSTKLQVRDSTRQPGDVANQLQNAGGLQRQTGTGLQQPTGGDQLQPNAKSDSLNAPVEAAPN